MSSLNAFSQYDENLANLAFGLDELRMESFPHLLGIAPEIRKEIFRYLLHVDDCRHESENEDWVENYQHTGHGAGVGLDYPPLWRALRSWLFNDTSPSAYLNSSIKGSSPWRAEIDLHPAILKTNKLLLNEGMRFIASENIFVQIRTDVPDYDVHLQWFGLPVFTYHKRSYEDRCKYERIMNQSGLGFQSFRTMIEIDMRTDQNRLLSQLKHFYLIPFKDMDQILRALYLTEGREQAWFRFAINLKHVPRPMRPEINSKIIDWLFHFRPVGSISVIIPEEGFTSHPITDNLSQPFEAWEFVFAVQKIIGFKSTTNFPLSPPRSKPFSPKDREMALTQLSKISALLTQNHALLRRLSPDATRLLATLVSGPLHILLQLEYTAAKNNSTAFPTQTLQSQWQMVHNLSLLALSLPSTFQTQRLLTLHTHLHALTTLGHEKIATGLMVHLLVDLRMHILIHHNHHHHSNNNNNSNDDDDKEEEEEEEEEEEGIDVEVQKANGYGLTKKTRALVNVARYALEEGFVAEGEWGTVFLMGVWEGLVRDGWEVVRMTGTEVKGGNGNGKEGEVEQKKEEGKGKVMGLEEIWNGRWAGRFT